jgi:transposase
MRTKASTDREKAFDMKAEGLTTREVSKRLGITLEEAIDLIYGGQTMKPQRQSHGISSAGLGDAIALQARYLR